jgi:hypothetical protein
LPDNGQVLIDQLLQLVDSIRQGKRAAGQVAMLCLDGGLPQRRGERLVHFVICKMFGLARKLGFLGGDCERGKHLGCLPGAEIDDRFL